jgi:hypothetical protein
MEYHKEEVAVGGLVWYIFAENKRIKNIMLHVGAWSDGEVING